MDVLSVHEELDIKFYKLKDNNNDKYIAEQAFGNKEPRSRILADIKRNIENVIVERKNLIKDPTYINYQGFKQVEGEYCLIRSGTEIYKPIDSYLGENKLTLDRIVEWMIVLGRIALEAEENGIVWQGMAMDCLWVDQQGELKLLDPDIASQLAKYREIDSINPIEIYNPPEKYRNMELDTRSLIYSLGIIMYYLATGEKPFTYTDESETDKSDLVHEILNTTPIETIYLNPQIAPSLNVFIMEALNKDKKNRLKGWKSFLSQLETIKKTGVKASGKQESIHRSQADKVIKSSTRKKGLKNFWRKRWKVITIAFSVFIILYLITITGGGDPYITEETPPEQVVNYFYQSIDGKNTTLIEETTIVDLKRLENMVAETHVIEKMQSAYNVQSGEEEGIFGIKDLSIVEVAKEPQPIFQANYTFYYNIVEQSEDWAENEEPVHKRYAVDMNDRLELGNVEGLWRIVNIEGSIEYIIEGKTMELLEKP